MSAYGNKLNPYRKIREPRGVKGIRQSVSITNNPSTIDQNQQLLVRFPNLSNNDVIVPGTTRLAFEIELTSTDDNATIYQNIGRAIVKKTTIRISGNEIMSIDDSDIYHCYVDLWKSTSERLNMAYQGIGETNMLKHRVGADDKASDTGDEAIATAYGARFCIPLDFELLETHMPFYQAGLGDRLEYELTFNNYSNVIKSTDTSASYTIKNICLEFDMVTDAELARQIRQQVNGKMVILYDRILRHRKITKNKSDTLWNINLNVPARSMKGILMLFEDPERTSTETYYNPNITKVEMTIEGVPNQLYSQGMKAYQQWDEINKFFALNSKRNKTTEEVLKDLNLSYTTLEKYLTTNYALWLDLRSTDDNSLHGSGRRIENASEVREANGSLYEEEKLQELLRMFFKKYAGHSTLYIIDDCSATKELTKKKDMLSELAFSGRHAEQSVWVISQRYNSVLKDLREQTKWLCMFYTKDRDSFDNCLRENDVIPTLEERQRIKEELKKKKHRKLILKTDQPTDYWLLN
ncbi:unnamed protein product [Mytilus edulis]|uniref:Uncharacterized protein n=1 Tax=Mytilus edulis TaxID=6550 RepID=A0A8S3QHK8_MYTED|nr:unnamed protein product [Mytilus edulis]